MNLMTVPEFFQVKFSRNLRVFVGILVAVGGILNMGVFLRIEGTFLAIISGISLSHIKAVMTAILLLELVYTVLGGMVSIVITDFIQFVALSIGTILVTIWSVHAAGVTNMYNAVRQNMGDRADSIRLQNSEYGWAYIAFQVLIWLAVHTCWQTTAMRNFSTRSPEVSKRVFSWAGFIFLGRGMMPMMWGIAALAMLGPNQNSLEAMPRMLATILPSGVLGLVVAGMLAATMSVNSSYLLGWSAIIAQDIIRPVRQKPSDFAAAGDAESRREPVRQLVRDGVGTVVHAAGSDILLSQHDRLDLSLGNAGRGSRRIVLEPRLNTGRIPGDGWRRGGHDRIFLLQDSGELCGCWRFRAGWQSGWSWARLSKRAQE